MTGPEEMRALFGACPTPVAVVTAFDAAGGPCGMTCNSVSSVSLHPPTLLVCLSTGSRTMAAVTAAGAFAVNFLAAGAAAVAREFATSRPDKFAVVAYAGGASPVLLDDVVGWARCTVVGAVPGAEDHTIVLGEVHETRAFDAPPLVYFHRAYVDWPPVRVEPR